MIRSTDNYTFHGLFYGTCSYPDPPVQRPMRPGSRGAGAAPRLRPDEARSAVLGEGVRARDRRGGARPLEVRHGDRGRGTGLRAHLGGHAEVQDSDVESGPLSEVGALAPQT